MLDCKNEDFYRAASSVEFGMIEMSEIAAMHLNILLNLETEWKAFDMANLSIGITKFSALYLSCIIFSRLQLKEKYTKGS